MTHLNQAFFEANRKALHNQLQERSITVLFAGQGPKKSADYNYVFTPNRNFYYVTGIDVPQVIYLAAKWGDTVEETLFIERHDPVRAKWEGDRMSAEEARERSGIQNVAYVDEFIDRFRRLAMDDFRALHLDLERDAWDLPSTRAQVFARETTERYPYLKIENVYHAIADARRFKKPEEIANMREAIRITDLGIRNMLAHAKPGMMEYELEAHFDFTLKSNGIKERGFDTILASGPNATVLHYEANDAKSGEEDLVLIDLGVEYAYYKSDISRTFPINGTFTDRQKELYNIVLKAELEVIANIKPGVPFKRLNEIAKEVLASECKRIGLIKEDAELANYYYHGVSHYLGLDVHDVGTYRDAVLEPGMVLTVEPGLYIAEESIGIRIEDDVLVTEDGHEVLSKDILKTVEEIEAFMAARK